MEEEKLIRKKKKAFRSGKKNEIAQAYEDLATFYHSHNRFSDALEEFKALASVYKEMNCKLEWSTCNRMIGEMYMLMGEFEKALSYEEKHLAMAKEICNQVEEQRAMATLGRIHLLKGQSTSNDTECKASLKAAEKAFLQGLVLCDKLIAKPYEVMDMRARLLLNIGVVQEHLGFIDKAFGCIQKAISICTKKDIFEVLYQCYMTEALLYANKKKDNAKALGCLNKALEVASRFKANEKVPKMCEALSAKADILCKMSDFQSAKQVLLKAWKMNTTDDDEKENIETNLKVVAAMCYTEDLLITTDPGDHKAFKRLYEKLADGACHLKNYTAAIEWYLKMLDHAELAGETGKALIPIYVSLYQTYKDGGRYSEALDYYHKEYELIKDVPREAFTTLYSIAETSYLAKRPYEQVEKACHGARDAARDWNKKKYEIRALKSLLKYQEEYYELDKMEVTKGELRALGFEDFDRLENSDDEQSSAGGEEDTAHIGDDVCLQDLTDLSDNNEEEPVRRERRRGRPYTLTANTKGESSLHLASISGNRLLAERLLGQGHPVNVRDHAGWLPLHEACIHGRLPVVELLLDHGASVNDRGGVNCDGITPLYDAASNGHLEVVLLLLDRGALPSLKTDFGETPLQMLQKWRKKTILNKEEETLYKNICNRIQNYVDKTALNEANVIRSKSKTPVKPLKNTTPPSTSKMTSAKKNLASPVFKRRNIIDDDSDDDETPTASQPAFPSDDSNSNDSIEIPNAKKKSLGVKEYRDAISALRNRNNELPEVEIKGTTRKPALLEHDEVGDDWLDDDMGTNKSKKRKLSDPLTTVNAKKPSYDKLRDTIDILNSIEPLVDSHKNNIVKSKTKSRLSDVVITDNSSDSEQCNSNENISPKSNAAIQSMRNISRELNDSKTRDSRDSMKSRWKRQSTLLKAGFQRNRECDQSSNSGSDNESYSRRRRDSNRLTPVPLSRKSSSDSGFGIVQNMNPSIVQSMNVIQPINIMRPGKNSSKMTQILPPAAVKVQVEDKTFLISLKLDTINKLTISWLVEEVKSRYYKLTGARPVFSLMTSDDAILSEDDPLSLVLASPELKTRVVTWRATPAEERYLECCEALGLAPSEEIQQAVGRSHTTHRMSLGERTLSSSQIRPLFRALTHQSHITAILVPDNNLRDDGMKFLTECICTIKQLTQLDLSKNEITSEGTKLLLNAFEKSTRPICQYLDSIELSDNPIGDAGFKHIVKICDRVKLKVLRLKNCGITDQGYTESGTISLDRLESLDISKNGVKFGVVSCLLKSLNANLLTDLDLDDVGLEGSAVGPIATFLDSAKELKIRRFCLSGCKLVDGQFMRTFRSLGRAKNLQTVTLRNNNITFIALKKLLQRQPPVPQLNLEGCQDIFKYSPDSDFTVWLPAVAFGRCLPEINLTPVSRTDEERESVKAFSKTWLSCFKGRGMIEHCDGGVVRFSAR